VITKKYSFVFFKDHFHFDRRGLRRRVKERIKARRWLQDLQLT